MYCNAEVRGDVLYLDWSPIECEFVKVFLLREDGEYVEAARIMNVSYATVSRIPNGPGRVYVEAWTGDNEVDRSEKIPFVVTGFGGDIDHIDAEDSDADADGFLFRSAYVSYKDMIRITWKCDVRADGFEVCTASTRILICDVTDGNAHSALTVKRYLGEAFIIKPYLNTPDGREYLQQSLPVEFNFKRDKSPKVSVIVPVSNAEKFLADCVDSIIASSLDGVEILVVPEESEDNTREIADWYSDYYSNVKLIKAPSAEEGTTRALKKARAQYVLFVNVFDRIFPDTLEKYYEAARKTNADIVFSRIKNKDYFGYYNDAAFEFANGSSTDSEEYLTAVSNPSFLDNFKWNKMYRKSLIKKFSYVFWDYSDSAFLPFIFSYAGLFTYLEEPLYEKNALFHELVLKALEEESTPEDFEEFRAEGIKFFYQYSNEKHETLIKKIAMMQMEALRKEAGNDASYLALEDALKAYDNNERKEMYDKALKRARRNQRIIKWIILGVIVAMGAIRLLSLLMKQG